MNNHITSNISYIAWILIIFSQLETNVTYVIHIVDNYI